MLRNAMLEIFRRLMSFQIFKFPSFWNRFKEIPFRQTRKNKHSPIFQMNTKLLAQFHDNVLLKKSPMSSPFLCSPFVLFFASSSRIPEASYAL